jgi:glutathione S-transferase
MSAFVALTEKQLSFEVRTLDLAVAANNDPEYARTSLTQRVPTLIDGDFALSESSAIAEYLNDAYPDPPIFPADLHELARARQVQAWLRSDFMPIRQERPTTTIFYRPVSTPLSSAAQISSRKLCAAASGLLSHGGENLFGRWSIADVDLALMLNRLILNGDDVPIHLVRYAKAQWERPSVQLWVRRERPPTLNIPAAGWVIRARDRPRRPDPESTCPWAACLSARIRRWGCRRADTSSRRCAAISA